MGAPPSPLLELLTDDDELRGDHVRVVLRPSAHIAAIASDEAIQYTKKLSLRGYPSSCGLWGLLQTASNPFCTFQVPLKSVEAEWITGQLYFVPTVDTVILTNQSSIPMVVSSYKSNPIEVMPEGLCTLGLGSWILGAAGEVVANLYILPKTYSVVAQPTESIRKTRKRAHDDEDGLCPESVISVRPEPVTARQLGDLPKNHTISIKAPGNSYTIRDTRQIASTSLSGVFSATHSELGCIVVKYVRPARSSFQGHAAHLVVRAANNWLQEARLQRQLKHEAVVCSFGADARFFYIFQELAEGYNLGTARWMDLSSHMFIGTDDDARMIMKGIISFLVYLHNKEDIAHGDLKPRNVLHGPPTKVCDFGSSYKPGCWKGGSPRYIGPELLFSRDMVGKHTDIFALGITALYLYKICPLPESKRDWSLADLLDKTSPDRQDAAQKAMISWLDEVAGYRSKLNDETDPLGLIRDMINPNFRARPLAEELERRYLSMSNARCPLPQDTSERESSALEASPYDGSTTQEDSQDLFELYQRRQTLR